MSRTTTLQASKKQVSHSWSKNTKCSPEGRAGLEASLPVVDLGTQVCGAWMPNFPVGWPCRVGVATEWVHGGPVGATGKLGKGWCACNWLPLPNPFPGAAVTPPRAFTNGVLSFSSDAQASMASLGAQFAYSHMGARKFIYTIHPDTRHVVHGMSSRPSQVLLRSIEACVCWSPNPYTASSLKPLVRPLTKRLETLEATQDRMKVATLNDCATVVLALSHLAKGQPNVALPSIWKSAFAAHVLKVPVFTDLPDGTVVVSVDVPTMHLLVAWKVAAAAVCYLTPHGMKFDPTRFPDSVLSMLQTPEPYILRLVQPTLSNVFAMYSETEHSHTVAPLTINEFIPWKRVPVQLTIRGGAVAVSDDVPCAHVQRILRNDGFRPDELDRVHTFPLPETDVPTESLTHSAFFITRKLVGDEGGEGRDPCCILSLSHVPSLCKKPRLLMGAPSVLATTMHIQAKEPALPKSLHLGAGVCPTSTVEVTQWAVVSTTLPPISVGGNPHAPAPAFVCRISDVSEIAPELESVFVVARSRSELMAACPRVNLFVCSMSTLRIGRVTVQLDDDDSVTSIKHFTAFEEMNAAIWNAWVWAVNSKPTPDLPHVMDLCMKLVSADGATSYLNCVFQVETSTEPWGPPPSRPVAISY